MKTRSFACLLALGFAALLSTGQAAATELQLLNGWATSPYDTSPAEAYLDDGIVHLKGGIAGGTTDHVFTLPVGLRPATDVYVATNLYRAAAGRLYIQADGDVFVTNAPTGDFSQAQGFTSLDGVRFAPAASGFTPLTLLNGWTNAPFTTSDAAVALIDGIVHFKGAIHNGTATHLFTLPVGFRPATNVFVPIGLCNAVKGRLNISPSGVVAVQSTTDLADAQCFTSLDGASFALSATGFTPVALQNGWTNGPFSTSDAAVSMVEGIVRFKGAIADGASEVAFTLPVSMRPTKTVWVQVDHCGAAMGRIYVFPSGDVTVQPYEDFADAQCFTSLDGVSFIPTQEGFVDLALQNGWSNGFFSTADAGVAKYAGIVHLRGAITNGSTNAPFTLPVTVRPEDRVYVPVDLCAAAMGRLIIEPSGSVTVQAASGDFGEAQCFVSLEGVTFAPAETGFTPLTLVNGWTPTFFDTSDPSAAIVEGMVHLKGAISSGSTTTLFTLPLEMRPSHIVYAPTNLCASAKGRLIVQTNGVVSVQVLSGDLSEAQCFTSLDGVKFAPGSNGFAPLTLANNWIAYSPSSPPAASIVRDIVRLRGAISSGTTSLAFTLPPILRPPGVAYVPIDLCNANKGRLIVYPTGEVEVQAATTFGEAQCFTSLDGAAFAVPEPAGHAALLAGLLWMVRLQRSRAKPQGTSDADARRMPVD